MREADGIDLLDCCAGPGIEGQTAKGHPVVGKFPVAADTYAVSVAQAGRVLVVDRGAQVAAAFALQSAFPSSLEGFVVAAVEEGLGAFPGFGLGVERDSVGIKTVGGPDLQCNARRIAAERVLRGISIEGPARNCEVSSLLIGLRPMCWLGCSLPR